MSSDPSKFPFDSVPLDGAAGAATLDPPRPSFSRSVPDVSSGGLLPPTRKPVSVTVPDPVALTPPAVAANPNPNPMASTPPPKAGSVRGFLWDLVRPTRTKWAILAGGVSLAAGAYGLNLFVPTPTEAPKTKPTETAKLTGPQPQIGEERQPKPVVAEERHVAALPSRDSVPSPLPIMPVKSETTLPAPPVFGENPTPAAPLPLPALDEKPKPAPLPLPAMDEKPKPTPIPVPVFNEPPKPVPLPPVAVEPAAPTPLPAAPKLVDNPPPAPVDTLPKPVITPIDTKPTMPVIDTKPTMPVAVDTKPVAVTPLPKPVLFTETPDPAKKVELVPASDVKLPPIGGEPKLPPIGGEPKLPPIGGEPKLPPIGGEPKPVEAVPVMKPSELIPPPKPVDAIPFPSPKPVAVDPIPAPPLNTKPVFKEEPPTFTGVGTKEPPPAAPVGGPPPKKGFDVDVVKVRANDTYTSISEAFYQSRKYATALREFNGNADIGRLQEVEVPPLHELQKLGGVPAREAEPTGGGRAVISPRTTLPTEPPVRGPVIDPLPDAGESVDWGTAGKRRAVIKYEPFTTPKEGMTPRDVARFFYDDESQWTKLIGPRGAKLRADDRLPRGTELTVPREELSWK